MATPQILPSWAPADDDERVIWHDTPHEKSIKPYLWLSYIACFVLVGIPCLWFFKRQWSNFEYVLTDEAVYMKSGVTSTKIEELPLDEIRGTNVKQHHFGSKNGYGNVVLTPLGGGGVGVYGNYFVLQGVANPHRVLELINEQRE